MIVSVPQQPSAAALSNRCVVCDSPGATKHYDQLCCAGCKAFFLRSIRNRKEYLCATGDCSVEGLVTDGKRMFRDEPPPDPQNSAVAAPSSRLDVVYQTVNRAMLACRDPILSHYQRLHIPITLPLGVRRMIPQFDPNDLSSITHFYVNVEQLTEVYAEHDFNHVFAPKDAHFYSMDVTLRDAFLHPRMMSARSKMEWSPNYMVPPSFAAIYARLTVLFADWASFVVEVQQLEEDDRLRLLTGRAMQWIWLTLAHKSFGVLRANGRRVLLAGGGSFMPVLEEEMDTIMQQYGQVAACSRWAYDEMVVIAHEMQMTENEWVLLKVIAILTPVLFMSTEGAALVKKAQAKYREALVAEVLRQTSGDFAAAMQRLARLLGFLTVVESCARIEDDSFATMSMFNLAEMQGEFTFEFHVSRKYRYKK
ncbi:hypothetical protein M3Y99_01213400 [Aphelenchoides fujianensis]|nr:hypothetical protein M3Y99_01213400 [Aphelenchoides fujianensis]